jgi:uncharacterized membrane protein YdjX (TVP38/TMEM64 family)
VDTESFGLITRRHFLELFSLILFLFVLLNPFDLSLSLFYSSVTPEAIRGQVLKLGVYAPLGMIVLEALQIIIAPVPPVTMVASGYIFGLLPGTLYTFVGVVLGSAVALLASRTLGRPAAESIVGSEYLDRFQDRLGNHYYFVIALLFAVPGFPHDALCYIAGLTDLDLRKLLMVISLARIPVVVGLVLTGSSIASSRTDTAILVLSLFGVIGLASARNQKTLVKLGRRLENRL